MTPRPFALALLTAAALVAPPAHATGPERFGGCGFVAAHTFPQHVGDWRDGHPTGTWAGAVDLEIAFVSPDGVPAATVRCDLWINGVLRETFGPVSVVGAVGAGAWPLTYETTDRYDLVDMCTAVDFADATPDVYDCPVSAPTPPPNVVRDFVAPHVDPFIAWACTDDVWVGGEWLVDCPPHDG